MKALERRGRLPPLYWTEIRPEECNHSLRFGEAVRAPLMRKGRAALIEVWRSDVTETANGVLKAR